MNKAVQHALRHIRIVGQLRFVPVHDPRLLRAGQFGGRAVRDRAVPDAAPENAALRAVDDGVVYVAPVPIGRPGWISESVSVS